MINIVLVQHPNQYKEFAFKTDLCLEVGDMVVCDTIQGYATGTVTAIDQNAPATKWIVTKVDLAEHKERLEKEQKFRELQNKMVQRRKQIEEREIYNLLAAKDDVLAKMLKEYDELKAELY